MQIPIVTRGKKPQQRPFSEAGGVDGVTAQLYNPQSGEWGLIGLLFCQMKLLSAQQV